ncbi:hypothetical protein HW555_008675 [Spodoptera exigua]|uniref:Uncharacterized protein n=1 Tax=Spodoptera exigua TaxID=7107 RepID=A0A835L491_SPOEX|nr:hypothetical protein HW555_008675 [Spodoptera exigua]
MRWTAKSPGDTYQADWKRTASAHAQTTTSRPVGRVNFIFYLDIVPTVTHVDKYSWYIILTRSVTAGCPVVTGRQKVCIYLNLFYKQEILRRADKQRKKRQKGVHQSSPFEWA